MRAADNKAMDGSDFCHVAAGDRAPHQFADTMTADTMLSAGLRYRETGGPHDCNCP
jgi:hypothetical protein